eukprot:jgi/Chrzof1/12129/Cz06g22090.t1
MDPAKIGQLLDDDDEFEDFPQDDWGPNQQDPRNLNLWDQSWDDDSIDDYVGAQIRTVAAGMQQQQQQQQAQQPPQQQQGQPQQGQPQQGQQKQ